METYNKCKVVMLPTKNINNSSIILGVVPNWAQLTSEVLNDQEWQNFGKPQHLYILSEEEIKEGDWCLGKDSDGKNYLIQMNNTTSPKFHYEIHKIIASTDLNLRIPQIHQSFISLCIEEYNKENIIEEVEVEYEDKGYPHYYTSAGGIGSARWIKDLRLKINPDNTISIKPLKNSWNREEIVNLFEKFNNEKCIFPQKILNDWLKQNL